MPSKRTDQLQRGDAVIMDQRGYTVLDVTRTEDEYMVVTWDEHPVGTVDRTEAAADLEWELDLPLIKGAWETGKCPTAPHRHEDGTYYTGGDEAAFQA